MTFRSVVTFPLFPQIGCALSENGGAFEAATSLGEARASPKSNSTTALRARPTYSNDETMLHATDRTRALRRGKVQVSASLIKRAHRLYGPPGHWAVDFAARQGTTASLGARAQK